MGDTTTRWQPVIDAFATYGITADIAANGDLLIGTDDYHTLETTRGVATNLRLAAATEEWPGSQGADPEKFLDQLEELLAREPRLDEANPYQAGRHGDQVRIPANRVPDALIDLDLVRRSANMADAGQPADELAYIIDAGNRRRYDQLGDTIGFAADLLEG